MSKEPHVVRLTATQDVTSGMDKTKLSQLVSSVRDLVLTDIEALLNKMMDSADDKLFDMADKSTEVVFFHSMRQLRIKRSGFIQRYKQEMEHYFQQNLSSATYQHETENVEELTLDNISLLKGDDLEENLAIDGMVAKAKSGNNTSALMHLETRLDLICPTIVINNESNPLDPKFICESFRTAAELLDLDIECRLVIYKLFERFVITGLTEIYENVNNLLADKGVLPDLHKRKPKVRHQSEPSNQSNASQSGYLSDERSDSYDEDDAAINERYSGPERRHSDGQSVGAGRDNIREEVFNTIQELLSERKASHHEPQVVDTRQLVSALTNLQNDQGYITPEELTSPQQFRQVLGNYLPPAVGNINGSTIGNANDDVIDIVSMLFDFILEDKNLHNDIKALISRLQIPMLKVGLVDRKFFSNRNHPARKLLNELAHAGIGWSPSPAGANDPFLSKVSEIVEKILVDFTDDIELFEGLRSDFEHFQQSDSRRLSIIEQRMREAEEGKAKANNARQKVNAEISRICHSRLIPEPVKQILKEAWTNVLFLELLKPNNQQGWDKALKVAEFLVWSVQPKTGKAAEEKLKKVMPSLVRNLKLGMDKISFSSFRSAKLLEQLEVCHRKILHVVSEQREQVSGEDKFSEAVAQITQDAFKEIGETATHETIQELSIPERDTDKNNRSDVIIAEMDVSDDDPVYQQVDQLQAGTWVELVKSDGEHQRCKLAAFIASSERYIFVNRSGMKVAEFTRQELAMAVKQEVLNILDDAALFDRALESVITNLRTMKEA